MIRTISSSLLALLFAFGCATAPDGPPVDLVLLGGHVVDVQSGEILENQDVWISEGKITAVYAGGTRIPKGTQRVDVSNRYLMPGLVDAHVHLDHVDELELYTAHGVTTVFNMRGLPRHLTWRNQIRAGERNGPTIYTAGDYMDGYPPFMQPMMSFDNTEEAIAAVRAQADAGYDMIKVYTRLSLEQLQAITATAAELGLPVVGHGSKNYPLVDLVAAGQANAAHGQDLLRWYSDSDDEDSVSKIVAALRGGNTSVTANMAFTEGLIRQAEELDLMLAEQSARSLPPAILQPFRRANNRYIRRGIDWVPSVKARLEKEKRLARELQEAGVLLLAGTDASTSGVLPGSSLFRELRLLREAGLSPVETLRTATMNPGLFVAKHIDAKQKFGLIREGYRADILVLKENPLEDLEVLSDSAGVVIRGAWKNRETLDERLTELEEESLALTPRVIEIEDAIKAGELAQARKLFDAARAERPDAVLFSQYVPFFIGYSFLYGEGGYNPDPERRAAALMLYKMYAETYPEFHSSHYMLALAYQANGDIGNAIASLNKAITLHPYYPDARKKLAELESE